jgi:AcrR family transcriptional regulator
MTRRPTRTSTKAKKAPEIDEESTRIRSRILAAFSAKAKRSGIRAVVMGELASELRMSPVTLYKHFASKNELVSAMVDAWALELAAIDALDLAKIDEGGDALARLLAWANAWTSSLAHVSPAFFKDLNRDHPEHWQRFQDQIEARKVAAAPILRPLLRAELDPTVALLMLDHLVMWASDPRNAERLGVSRHEAVRSAVSIWGSGALQKTKLRAVARSSVRRR